MALKSTKMIKVTSRGYVMTSRGRVLAPIRTPYRESVSKIWSMITTDRADVWEKLPNGEFIQLTPLNFDKDNSSIGNTNTVEFVDEATFAPTEETKDETPVEEVKEPVEDKVEEPAPTEDIVEEEQVDEKVEEPTPVNNSNNNQNKNYNKFDKKNKHNKPNNNQNKTNASDIAVTPEQA